MITALLPLMLAALSAHAASPPDLYQASYELESAQDYQGSLARLEQLPSTQHDYVFHLRSAWLLYLLARYDASAAAYAAAVDAEPTSVEARQGLVLPLMALERWDEARQACEALLALAPDDYRGRSRLAWVLYNSGRYEDAAKRYADVLVHYPSDVEMRAGLGWSLLKLGRVTEAQAEFARVLRFAPSHVSAKEGMEASR